MKWFRTTKHFAMQEWIQCAMFTSQFIWKVNQPVNQLNQTEPNKNKNKTPNETCANTSIRTHIRGTNLIEMESAKLKIKIISIGWACNCECEKMRCQQLDVRTEWVNVALCQCVFFSVFRFTRLGMSLTLIYSFIFCLLLFSLSFIPFLLLHSVCEYACEFGSRIFCMRSASTSIALKSSERYWRAREHVFVFVCILKQCWCILRMCVGDDVKLH